MTSRLKWLAILALVVVIGAAATPWRFWSDVLRAELAAQVRRTTGLEALADGRVSMALLPTPRIDFEGVAISDPDGALTLHTEKFRGVLRLWPLLLGRLEFASVRLHQPRFSIEPGRLRAGARSVLQQASAAGPASREAQRADLARLGSVVILGGSAAIHHAGGGEILLDQIEAVLNWPRAGDAATLAGTFQWRGESAELEAFVARPAELLRGETSAFAIKIASTPLDLSLNGALSGGARWLMDARLAASSDKLRSLLALADPQLSAPARPERFNVSGQLRALPQSLSLADMKLQFDANAIEGSLALRLEAERPLLSGTLATRGFDIGQSELGLPALRGADRHWSRDTFAPPRLDAFDADLRVSAGKMRLGQFVMSDVGALVSLNQGKLEVTVAGADAYSGKLKGRIGLARNEDNGVDLRASASFVNMESSGFLRDVARAQRVSGAASGDLTLSSSGASVAALMQGLSGSVRTMVRKGEITGVDVEQAVRRAEKRPLSIPGEMRSGQTAFVTADTSATIAGGVVTLDRATVSGLGVHMDVSGIISIADRTLRLDVAAGIPSSISAPARAPVLHLDVLGPWEEPVLKIDTESLIRRSKAAAPLLPKPAPLPVAPEASPSAQAPGSQESSSQVTGPESAAPAVSATD